MGGDSSTARPVSVAGWTGGQWSLVRIAAGLLLFVRALMLLAHDLSGPAIDALVVPLMAGFMAVVGGWTVLTSGKRPALWLQRALAYGAAAKQLMLLNVVFGVIDGVDALAWIAVLACLAIAPVAPYLSWEARDRTDPRGDWRMPGWWTLLALVGFVGVSYALWTTELLVLFLPWTALLLFSVRPEWVPAVEGGSDRLFYDGDCGLCHRAVRFVMAEETRGTVRVAPLFGEAFERELTEKQRADLPDSLIVLTSDGRLLTRDEAVLRIGARCGGLWRVLGGLARVVPGPLRRWLYDRIAAVRRGLFQAPSGACPILPPDLRSRFDP